MSNSKISALPAASTPLAGTEVLPVVQGGITEQVSVANLTLGRATDALSLNLSSNNTLGTALNILRFTDTDGSAGAGQELGKIEFYSSDASTPGPSVKAQIVGFAEVGNPGGGLGFYTDLLTGTPIERVRIDRFGDTTLRTGNIIQGTAAKGFNFTANTPAAGMTSQLLNWYEEGTWTPNQGAGLTLVGAFSSTGRYTRIGRQVSISGTVTGATSVSVIAAGVITSNLPFTVVTAGHGGATNVANNASATVICTGTSVTSAAAVAATGTITFSATYFV